MTTKEFWTSDVKTATPRYTRNFPLAHRKLSTGKQETFHRYTSSAQEVFHRSTENFLLAHRKLSFPPVYKQLSISAQEGFPWSTENFLLAHRKLSLCRLDTGIQTSKLIFELYLSSCQSIHILELVGIFLNSSSFVSKLPQNNCHNSKFCQKNSIIFNCSNKVGWRNDQYYYADHGPNRPI